MAGFAEHFDDYWFEVQQLIDAGDAVVLLWRQGGKGLLSRASTTEEGATVFDLEGGSIWRAQVHSNRDEALEAVGCRSSRQKRLENGVSARSPTGG